MFTIFQPGVNFLRTPLFKVLSAYVGESEKLMSAISEGIITLPESMTAYDIMMDICTFIRGCVFEWCLNEAVDVRELAERIIIAYWVDKKISL